MELSTLPHSRPYLFLPCLNAVISDLWALASNNQATTCSKSFSAEWKKETLKKKPSLSLAFYRAFGVPFMFGGLLKAAQDVLGFVG